MGGRAGPRAGLYEALGVHNPLLSGNQVCSQGTPSISFPPWAESPKKPCWACKGLSNSSSSSMMDVLGPNSLVRLMPPAHFLLYCGNQSSSHVEVPHLATAASIGLWGPRGPWEFQQMRRQQRYTGRTSQRILPIPLGSSMYCGVCVKEQVCLHRCKCVCVCTGSHECDCTDVGRLSFLLPRFDGVYGVSWMMHPAGTSECL